MHLGAGVRCPRWEETQEGRAAFFPTQEGPAQLPTPAADQLPGWEAARTRPPFAGRGWEAAVSREPPSPRGPWTLPRPGLTSHVLPMDSAVAVAALQLQLHLCLHPRNHLLHAAELQTREGHMSPGPSRGRDCGPTS